MANPPAHIVKKLHLEDGADTDLDVDLTIVSIGENQGVVRMAYSNGEAFTLSHDMLLRITREVIRTKLREGDDEPHGSG